MRFHQSRTCGLTKRKIDLHFWIYFIICMIAVYLTCAMPVHASLGYYEVQDLYQTITDNVKEANDLLNKAFAFAKVSPFTILNSASGSIGDNVKTASKTAALSIATLLLMVDFFRKSVTFEWSSRWENILIFLVKVLVIKQVVQNTDVIMDNIYSGLDYINQKALAGGTVNFLPCGEMQHYNMLAPYRGDSVVEWVYSLAWHVDIPYEYNISKQAVALFYPNPDLPAPGTYNVEDYPFKAPVDLPSFTPLIESVMLQPYFLIMKAIAVVIFVIAIGRVFELCIYTILAPLPLATFASETTHEVAKNFLKNYVATILQVAVIVTMFAVYGAVNAYFTSLGTAIKYIQLVTLISLGLGVVKSGTWSKRICGIS